MFQPLNLFKSINCPFYIQSNNTITCERPYCQFRHPKLSSPVPETSPSPENVPETSHVQEASSNPSGKLIFKILCFTSGFLYFYYFLSPLY